MRLTGVLHDIKCRAPKALVFVVGCPAILSARGADGRGCARGPHPATPKAPVHPDGVASAA